MSSLADDVSRSSLTLQLQANTTEREIRTLANKVDLEVQTLNSQLTTTTQVLSSAVITEAHEVKTKIGTVNASMQSMKDEMANVTNRFDTEIGDVRNKTDSDVQTLNIRLSSYVQVLGHKIDEQVQEMDHKIETEIQTVNNKMASYVQVLSDKNAVEVQTLQRIAMDQDLAIQQAASSTFVRWGNSSCPSLAGVVYSGLAGGGLLSRQGPLPPSCACLGTRPWRTCPFRSSTANFTARSTRSTSTRIRMSCAPCVAPRDPPPSWCRPPTCVKTGGHWSTAGTSWAAHLTMLPATTTSAWTRASRAVPAAPATTTVCCCCTCLPGVAVCLARTIETARLSPVSSAQNEAVSSPQNEAASSAQNQAVIRSKYRAQVLW